MSKLGMGGSRTRGKPTSTKSSPNSSRLAAFGSKKRKAAAAENKYQDYDRDSDEEDDEEEDERVNHAAIGKIKRRKGGLDDDYQGLER